MSAGNAGKVHRLDEVRADGWFERLGEGAPSFRELCDVVGARFVAFAVIAGVRITAVNVDQRAPDASLVDFTVGDGGPTQRLPLGELRRRLASALLAEDEPARALPPIPKSDDLSALLGFRTVLLAPIFGVRLLELHDLSPKPARVTFEQDGARHELELGELRKRIKDHVRAEAARAKPSSPFAIDLALVPQAMDAAAERDHERVVSLLGAWPGPLSMLLRTAEGQSLTTEVRATLSRALGVLGSAYASLGKHDWAQEILRLGIQWAQDGAAAGELFRRLGDAHAARDRNGEAIGLFRRALQLGEPPAELLPRLALAFESRGRHLAAIACADAAVEAGAPPASVRDVKEAATRTLGQTWARFQRE